SRSENAKRTLQELGSDFVMLKEDGSLDHGFEIVTAPCDPAVHRERWAPFLKEYPKRRDLRSWNTHTCGVHIHVTRDALSALQLGKMLVFVNDPKHKLFIEFIASRDTEEWAKLREKKLSDGWCS